MSFRIAAMITALAGMAGTAAQAVEINIQVRPEATVQLAQYGTPGGTWVHCAGEDTFCVVPYPTIVRYGTNGRYYEQNIAGGVYCSNSVFGDPRPGRGKNCDFLTVAYAPPPPPQFPRPAPTAQPEYCASEDNFCSFFGTARVIYGVGNKVTSRVATNGIFCSNTVFGDPAHGQGKACYIVR